jgi:hypothetical protein
MDKRESYGVVLKKWMPDETEIEHFLTILRIVEIGIIELKGQNIIFYF